MKTTRLAALLLVCLGAAGCRARLNGSFIINGTPFQPTACRSGEVYGFVGVEFADAAGARLRLASTPSSVPMVYYLAPGGTMPVPIGMCGSLTVNRTNTRINNVYNVEGQAALACNAPGMQVVGNVTYANCH